MPAEEWLMLARICVTAAIVSSTLLAPRIAEACSQVCVPQPLAIANKILPIDTKVLPISAQPSAATTPVLRLAGEEIAITVGTVENEQAITPAAALAPGAYTLAYTDQCGLAEPRTASFTIGADVETLTRTGTLSDPTKTYVPGVTGEIVSNSCEAPPRTDAHLIASIELVPDASLAKYLPITRFEQTITGPDGQTTSSWIQSGYVQSPYYLVTLDVTCDPTLTNQPQQGTYTIGMKAHVIGSDDALEVATKTFSLICPAATDFPYGEGEGYDDGSLVPGGPPSDDAQLGDDVAHHDGGCSTSPMQPRTGAAGLLVAVAAVVAAIRRRR